MPELPEVEVITRGLRPHLMGKTITRIRYNQKPLRHAVELTKLDEELLNQSIVGVDRRAKYLQIHLLSGAILIIHLGMTGNLGIFSEKAPLGKHDHVQFRLEDGSELRYHDTRRFGSIHILDPSEALVREDTFFKTSGPEPFAREFSADYLYTRAKGKEVTVKQFIMTTQNVVGIGNIYANESLFRAGIRPGKKVRSLTKRQWQLLITTIQQVLTHAIDCGGSTISDFLNASQQQGYFQMNFMVYGKDGRPCPNCGTILKKSTIGGRASYFCTACQK